MNVGGDIQVIRGQSDMIWSLTSHPHSVRQALAQITTYLRARGVPEAHRLNVELVLAEVLNNICEHAYRGADDGRILTSVSCSHDMIQCHITDKGSAMPGLTPPKGRFRDPDTCAFDDLPEGGFGWGLIRAIAADVQYERRNVENHLFLQIASASAPCARAVSGIV